MYIDYSVFREFDHFFPTGVSIHFPDGNKNSEVRKSNQVSINSRGEELSGLEDARGAIRELTPLVFSFSLSANAQFINISDPNMLIFHVQNTYNVQVWCILCMFYIWFL